MVNFTEGVCFKFTNWNKALTSCESGFLTCQSVAGNVGCVCDDDKRCIGAQVFCSEADGVTGVIRARDVVDG